MDQTLLSTHATDDESGHGSNDDDDRSCPLLPSPPSPGVKRKRIDDTPEPRKRRADESDISIDESDHSQPLLRLPVRRERRDISKTASERCIMSSRSPTSRWLSQQINNLTAMNTRQAAERFFGNHSNPMDALRQAVQKFPMNSYIVGILRAAPHLILIQSNYQHQEAPTRKPVLL